MINQDINITTDSVIFYAGNRQLKVLLIKRKNDPFKDHWALPGGFLEEDETLEEGAKRELHEETGLRVNKLHQVRAFGAVGRDPRGRTISVAFLGKVEEERKVKGADDAREAAWFPVNDLPKLAFDHSEILDEARSML